MGAEHNILLKLVPAHPYSSLVMATAQLLAIFYEDIKKLIISVELNFSQLTL